MAGLDPWTYADKYKTEHAHQTALFMWANMAQNYGLLASNDADCYKQSGYAKHHYTKNGEGKENQFSDKVPQLKWLHAIHNQGHGDAIRGGMARAEGVKAGVSDIFLPVPIMPGAILGRIEVGSYYGLYLELKVGNNKPSNIQVEFMQDMKAAGYSAEWATGWLEARDKILEYLGIKRAWRNW